MELTRKLLEDRIASIHEQGIRAANVVQQAVGAETVLQELLQELALREAIEAAEPDEEVDEVAEALARATEALGEMNGLSE